MRILHLAGSEDNGGAAQATRTIQGLVGGDIVKAARSRAREAYRCIGGYYDPLLARWLRRLAASYDVVHLHRFGEWGTAALHTGKPTVYSAYDYWTLGPCQNLYPYPCEMDCVRCYQPKGRPWPTVAKLWLAGRPRRMLRHFKRLDALVVLSADQRQRLEGLTPAAASVIPLPVSIEPVDITRDRDQVLYLGWMAPNKGLDVVLRAWPGVRAKWPKAKLMVAGPQPNVAYAEQCKALASPGVIFLGEVSRPEAAHLLCESQVVVVPEVWPNPQPIVMCEALAVGTHVAASAIGGISQHGGPDTLYVYHGDPEDWAAKIGCALARRVAPEPKRIDPQCTKAQLEEVYQCIAFR